MKVMAAMNIWTTGAILSVLSMVYCFVLFLKKKDRSLAWIVTWIGLAMMWIARALR